VRSRRRHLGSTLPEMHATQSELDWRGRARAAKRQGEQAELALLPLVLQPQPPLLFCSLEALPHWVLQSLKAPHGQAPFSKKERGGPGSC